MKTVRDLLQHGTDADVVKNFAKCSTLLRRQADALPIAPVNDYIGLSAQRILRYVATEAEEAPSALRGDIKLFAWRTRNILESFFLLRHCMASSQNAEQFCAQRISDERTILEGFLSLTNESTTDTTPVRDRIAKANVVLKKFGFTKASPWRIDALADAVGMKDDYVAFYKLYSKYVHPSSWIIVADRDEFDNPQYWEVFLVNAQLYCHLCCGAGQELLESRGVQLPDDLPLH